MNALRTVMKWLFILCLPLLLITFVIGGMISSAWLYNYGFDKYNISQTAGLTDAELDKAAAGLISYFNSGAEYIHLTVNKAGNPVTLFNQREVIHLKDVKGLIWLDYRLFTGALIYMLGYALVTLLWRKEGHRLASGLAGGSGLTLALMLVMGASTLLDFDRLFIQFHLISFTNEFWQLDPATDYLIMLFPQGFWYDVFLLCGLASAGLAIIIGGTALLYLKKSTGHTA